MVENESSIPAETSPVGTGAPVGEQPPAINLNWQTATPETVVSGQPLGVAGWYRLAPDGGLKDAITKTELLAFERSAHVNGKDLLRGKKLKQRLDAIAALRFHPDLVLVDWADGPVFGPPSQIAPVSAAPEAGPAA